MTIHSQWVKLHISLFLLSILDGQSGVCQVSAPAQPPTACQRSLSLPNGSSWFSRYLTCGLLGNSDQVSKQSLLADHISSHQMLPVNEQSFYSKSSRVGLSPGDNDGMKSSTRLIPTIQRNSRHSFWNSRLVSGHSLQSRLLCGN